ERLASAGQTGIRVGVRFAGRLADGTPLERVVTSVHVGPLATLQRVSGPVQVLRPALRALCEATARRYGGTLADVLRLAIPPRHARGEKAVLAAEKERKARTAADGPATAADGPATAADGPATAVEDSAAVSGDTADDALTALPGDGGPDERLLGRLGRWLVEAEPEVTDDVGAPRRRALACTPGATPGLSWIRAGLAAARETLAAGRSVLWLVPDHRELTVLHTGLEAAGLTDIAVLSADQSPEQRWQAWLRGLLGHTRVTIGTRAAAFAPVAELGLIIC